MTIQKSEARDKEERKKQKVVQVQKEQARVSGLFNINKPPAITSHAVVQIIRQTLETQRVGHGGTLDPFATGVLIILCGPAARLSEYVRGEIKSYNAELKLGMISNTYDCDGIIKEVRIKRKPSQKQVEAVLKKFIGEQEQIPPIFSAKKIEGKMYYEMARSGEKFKPKPQKIYIHNINLLLYKYPLLRFKVTCSSGTYIRSLGHDIGQALSCGAYVDRLQRTRVGNFVIKDSVPLRNIRKHNFEKFLIPPIFAVQNLPKIAISRKEDIEKIKMGKEVKAGSLPKKIWDQDIALISEKKELLAIVRYDHDLEVLKPKKVLIS